MTIGARIAAALPQGGVVSLEGPLGAGKTTLVKGIGAELGVEDEVTSPTFTLIASYPGRLELHHVDLYRLDDPAEIEDLGIEELMGPGRITVIEWGDKAGTVLPDDAVHVRIVSHGGESRTVEVDGVEL
jgi:tRNA threonylcarbamoyladenosine biosynthesis protein TsaE